MGFSHTGGGQVKKKKQKKNLDLIIFLLSTEAPKFSVKRIDKSQITTIRRIHCWCFKCYPFVRVKDERADAWNVNDLILQW